MKLNKKQLALIFFAVLLLLLAGYYIFSFPQKSATPVAPDEGAPAVKVTPLSDAEQVRIKQMLTEEPVPLSQNEKAVLKEIEKSPPLPLSEADQAILNRMLNK